MATAWPNASSRNLWEYLPQITDVAYTSVQTVSPGNQTFTIPFVCTTPKTIVEREASFGVYKIWKTTFKIDPLVFGQALVNAGLTARYPKPRDTLVDDISLTWRVSNTVDFKYISEPDGSPWRLVCNRLVIESALCDTISINHPVDSTDNYLSPLTAKGTPSGPQTDMPCRIQFDRNELDNFQGVQFYRDFYKIYVSGLDDNLEVGAVVTATGGTYSGTVFRILSTDNVEVLDELEVLTATIDPVA